MEGNTLFSLNHPSRHLQQLVRGAEGSLPHFAEHLRKFKQTRLAIQPFDARQRTVALDKFLHLIVLVAKDSQLREMRHAEHLMQT